MWKVIILIILLVIIRIRSIIMLRVVRLVVRFGSLSLFLMGLGTCGRLGG